MPTKIDPKRPVFTRNGEPVEIISTAGRRHGLTILGYVGDDSVLLSWAEDGSFSQGSTGELDLVQPCEVWLNIYDSGTATFPTKEAALQATKQPIARVKVAYTPGQFD